jgi:O-antigen/teichoic acid export membrane protein
MMNEPAAERIFEADVAINMKSFRIFDSIGNILSRAHKNVISIQPVDQNSTLDSLCLVEQAILARLPQIEAPGVKGAQTERIADRAPASTRRDIDNHSVWRPGGGVSSVVSSVQQGEVGRRLVHASVYALLVYIGGAGLTSLAQLLIARLVGATSYGVYSYALAWSTFLAYLATLGFNVSLLRFVPEYRAAGRLDLARGVIIFALRWSLLAAILTGWGGAGLVYLWGDLDPELRATMLLGMAAVPLITAYALGATVVRAFGGVVSALLPERIVRDGLLLALLSSAALSNWWVLDAPLAMVAVIASSAATVALVLATAMRLRPAGLRDAQSAYAARQWWPAVPPIMLIAGVDVFISRTGVVLLGWSGQIREAGIFALGLNVALLVGLSRFAVGTMFSPAAADLHSRKDHEALQRLFSRATVLCFGGAVAVAIPLLLVTAPLLRWFGDEFASGAAVARILIAGYALTALFGPQQNLLTMTGHEWAAAMTMVFGAAANIVACAAGMVLGGTIGAATGVTLALLAWNLAMAIFIRKQMQILPGLIIAALATRPGQPKVRWG